MELRYYQQLKMNKNVNIIVYTIISAINLSISKVIKCYNSNCIKKKTLNKPQQDKNKYLLRKYQYWMMI